MNDSVNRNQPDATTPLPCYLTKRSMFGFCSITHDIFLITPALSWCEQENGCEVLALSWGLWGIGMFWEGGSGA